MQKRFDFRTKEEFAQDIKKHSKSELEIAIRICQDTYNRTKRWPTLQPNGTDYSGKFISSLKKVNIEPDFLIDGLKYEITKSKAICKDTFHQKEDKIKSALEKGYVIVYVNGFETEDEPEYCCLGYDELAEITARSILEYKDTVYQKVGGGRFIDRKVYRYKISWIKDFCKVLPKLDLKKIPKAYKKLLEKCD